MSIGGKWWLIREDEGFDRDENLWVQLADGTVSATNGVRGTYEATDYDVVLTLDPAQPGEAQQILVFSAPRIWSENRAIEVPITADTGALEGVVDDDDAVLWRDGPWVYLLTESNRERGNRYSTIDVSMYDIGSANVRAVSEASSVAEIEAALARLPLARVTHG